MKEDGRWGFLEKPEEKERGQTSPVSLRSYSLVLV